MTIWRYTEDGLLDTTFNGKRYRVFDSGNNYDAAHSVKIDNSGRIVVAGFSGTDFFRGTEMVIWRFDSDGQPDAAFGGNGMVSYPGGRGFALAIDASGRILVAGDINGHMTLWRYNGDGTPDPTFGDNGLITYDSAKMGFSGSIGASLAIDIFGRITVAGEGNYEPQPYIDREMVVWRYLSDGAPDANFSDDGVAIFNSGGTSVNGDGANSIAIDHSWHPVVTGFIGTGTYEVNDDDMAIWRIIP